MDAAGTGAANETAMIPRRTLRQDVGDRLRDRLVQGELQAGERINESTLSLELGVSRTPLRKALRLERDGLIRSEPAKGFTVSPLTSAEVLEVYPVDVDAGGFGAAAQQRRGAAGVAAAARPAAALRGCGHGPSRP